MLPDGLAGGGSVARCEYAAGLLALAVEARQRRGTVSVRLALGSDLGSARGVRVAHHGGRAATQRQVVVYHTLGLAGAWVLVHARVDTLTCITYMYVRYN